MNGFDDLLDEVLREDGNQHLPSGMKYRMLASLPHEDARRNFPWAGMAAALLLGAVGISAWTFVRPNGQTNGATNPTGVLVVRSTDAGSLAGAGVTRLPTPAHRYRRPMPLRPDLLTRLPSQQRPIQIAPLVIESLVIEPVRITPINYPDSPKGTSR